MEALPFQTARASREIASDVSWMIQPSILPNSC